MKLREILASANLGLVRLGMHPFTTVEVLGDPTARSNKTNPLILVYGSLQLVFFKSSKDADIALREIQVNCLTEEDGTPQVVKAIDPNVFSGLSLASVKSYLLEHGLPFEVTGDTLTTESGVSLEFEGTRLSIIRISYREMVKQETPTQVPLKESSERDILAIVDEALAARAAGAINASLLVAWAAVEASLRHRAISLGLQAKPGVQVRALLRELQATGNISAADFDTLLHAHRLRSVAAHGLALQPVESELIDRLISIAKSTLNVLGTKTPQHTDA